MVMFWKVAKVKTLYFYIFIFFVKRFFIVLFFAGILAFLVETIATVGKFNMFNFFLNLKNIFGFVFFISSTWCIISMQKTREFIIFQVSTLSTLTISGIFLTFSLIFGIFYLSIYNGLFLKALSPKQTDQNLFLEKFSFYSEENNCDYSIISLNNVNFNASKAKFSFLDGDFLKFEDCKFQYHKTLSQDTIQNNEGLTLANNKLSIDYNFDVLVKYFEEKVENSTFKTFFSKIQLIMEFEKFKIDSHKLKIEVLEEIHVIISFLYMTLIAFLFFANVPPRSQFLLKFFFATCFVATIYITSMILTSWIKQFSVLNPALLLISPIIIFITMTSVLVIKKI